MPKWGQVKFYERRTRVMAEARPCPECDGHPEDTNDGDWCGTCGGDGYVVEDED